MGKVTVIGIDNFISDMEALGGNVKTAAGKAVYYGAKAVADSVRAGIEAAPDRRYKKGGLASGLTKPEKDGLLNGLGISRMRNDGGFFNVRIGFDGYNENGKANAMIARSHEAGTSWLQKNPFISSAARKAEAAATAAMTKTFESELKIKE